MTDRIMLHARACENIMVNFNWPDTDEVYLTSNFVPYSFFVREYCKLGRYVRQTDPA